MGAETSLDRDAATQAAAELEKSAASVAGCADRMTVRAFTPEVAGRNYGGVAATLDDALATLTAGLREWSHATTTTAGTVSTALNGAAAADAAAADRFGGGR